MSPYLSLTTRKAGVEKTTPMCVLGYGSRHYNVMPLSSLTAMSAEAKPQEQNGHIGIDQVTNLGAVITRLRDRIDELEDRLEAAEANDRDAQLQRVIDHADRKNRGGTVALNYAEVMAAADVSAPTAYSYMDELAENHERVRSDTAQDGTRRILINPC